MTMLGVRYAAATLGIMLTVAGIVMDDRRMIWVAIGALSVAVVLGMILRRRAGPID